MPRIIADDLGLAESINDGIIFLLKNGKIDGASLMANGEAFDDAIKKSGDLEDKIGIHFVLVEEKSLSGTKLPRNYKIFFIKYFFGLIKLSDIEKELRAQLDKILNAGIKPNFINSHQHLHLLPGIANIVIKIAVENNIKDIRLVKEPIHGRGKLFRKIQLLFLRWLSYLVKTKLIQTGLMFNDTFVGFLNAGDLNQEDIELAKSIRYGTVELGCHPGFEEQSLRDRYSQWGGYHWGTELELLKRGDVYK